MSDVATVLLEPAELKATTAINTIGLKQALSDTTTTRFTITSVTKPVGQQVSWEDRL